MGWSATYTHRCLLDDDVLDSEVLKFQTFCVSISFSVLEEAVDKFNGFLRPATFDMQSLRPKTVSCKPLQRTYPESS